ncbi:alpha/beta fold hydrolase [Fodinicurvata sp. EGI_FJ10296]|uniref:alpha/beta hydrolase family protein n=1 Tax=Fodinicurvata sp. EGI_FJ10296 TaxID=3231908 RepID=UPI0034544DF1
MKPSLSPALVVLGLFGASFPAAAAVGFTEIAVADPHGDRPLEVAVWYPAEAGPEPIQLGENPAFFGVSVLPDAPVRPGARDRPWPLAVLSHGYGGNWTNQVWLADLLVERGFVVAAPNHPGTTTRDRDSSQAARLWARATDISRTIDAVSTFDGFDGRVSDDRVAVIGHSLGGLTAMQVAGARFDVDRFETDCVDRPELEACDLFDAIGAGRLHADRAALAESRHDDRVGAAAVLDIGMARGLTPDSLAVVDVPVLVVSAAADTPAIPAELESEYLTRHLRMGLYHRAEGAAHFSFRRRCKPGAIDMLEAEAPGDGVVCRDAPDADTDRAEIHRMVGGLLADFLSDAPGLE